MDAFIGLLILGGIIFGIVKGISRLAGANDRAVKSLKERLNFTASLVNTAHGKILGVNSSDKTFACVLHNARASELLSKRGMAPNEKIYSYKDLISVELLEDETTLMRTETGRVSQIIGTAIGGVLLGPVGAVIGGTTGSKSTSAKKKVNELRIRLTVNDATNPVIVHNFLKVSTSKEGIIYKQAYADAERFFGVFKCFLNAVDQERASAIKQVQKEQRAEPSRVSKADEIEKLANLKKSGDITEEEFSDLKKKIIIGS